MQRVVRARHAHAAYLKERDLLEDSDDDEGPQNDDAWLFEDLRILAQLYSRLKDREQLIELIFEVKPLSTCLASFLLTSFFGRALQRTC